MEDRKFVIGNKARRHGRQKTRVHGSIDARRRACRGVVYRHKTTKRGWMGECTCGRMDGRSAAAARGRRRPRRPAAGRRQTGGKSAAFLAVALSVPRARSCSAVFCMLCTRIVSTQRP